jgi:hypothetical protein
VTWQDSVAKAKRKRSSYQTSPTIMQADATATIEKVMDFACPGFTWSGWKADGLPNQYSRDISGVWSVVFRHA